MSKKGSKNSLDSCFPVCVSTDMEFTKNKFPDYIFSHS